jgi:hypothetical protein
MQIATPVCLTLTPFSPLPSSLHPPSLGTFLLKERKETHSTYAFLFLSSSNAVRYTYIRCLCCVFVVFSPSLSTFVDVRGRKRQTHRKKGGSLFFPSFRICAFFFFSCCFEKALFFFSLLRRKTHTHTHTKESRKKDKKRARAKTSAHTYRSTGLAVEEGIDHDEETNYTSIGLSALINSESQVQNARERKNTKRGLHVRGGSFFVLFS